MTFATTKNGTTARAERMRIDNTGNVGIGTTTPKAMLEVNGKAQFDGLVGIGTTTPAYPLSVAGAVQSTSGGFVFPDGTTQTSAVPLCAGGQNPIWKSGAWTCSTPSVALGSGLLGSIANDVLTLNTDPTYLQRRVNGTCPNGSAIAYVNQGGTVICQAVGVLMTSPDNSVTVGGTATAPTVAVNTALVQARVTGTCAAGMAVSAVNADGTVTCATSSSAPSAYITWTTGDSDLTDPSGTYAHVVTDQAITVTRILIDVADLAADAGFGVCSPATLRVGSSAVYQDVSVGVGFTSYDSGNIALDFPAGSVIWVTLEQPGSCPVVDDSGAELPFYLNGSIRYHPTSS
jgi:hypothetical protein